MAAFGDQHPDVAISLNNLAQMLKDTDRLEEAGLLMRRSLDIFDSFARQTGHEHPLFQQAKANYQALNCEPWDRTSRVNPPGRIAHGRRRSLRRKWQRQVSRKEPRQAMTTWRTPPALLGTVVQITLRSRNTLVASLAETV